MMVRGGRSGRRLSCGTELMATILRLTSLAWISTDMNGVSLETRIPWEAPRGPQGMAVWRLVNCACCREENLGQ